MVSESRDVDDIDCIDPIMVIRYTRVFRFVRDVGQLLHADFDET